MPSTAFDRACRLVCSIAVDLDMARLLQGRARPETIRDWRRGKRRPPLWAIEVLIEELRRRSSAMLTAIADLEKERAARLPAP